MYTAIVCVTFIINIILIILIHDNQRLQKKNKISFIMAAVSISCAMVFEWAGLMLNGASSATIPLHTIVKCGDYIFTPLLAIWLIRQFDDSKFFLHAAISLETINIVLEIVSIFTGSIFYVDSENFYHHGTLYIAYMAIYLLMYLCGVCTFIKYCRHFKRRNLFSLSLIFISMIAGILVQEILGNSFRITYLVLAVCNIFLFVHYSEFYQQKNDEFLSAQNTLLRTDALTQMNNRYAYSEMINDFNNTIDESIVVFSADINALKIINDTYGHKAGDELIVGAADIITKVLSQYGSCFRTGGDEFVCITKMPADLAELIKQRLVTMADNWRGEYTGALSLSIGYAAAKNNNIHSIEDLIILSDKMMYRDKKQYYETHPDVTR